ncbi:sensor histidine kinase [Paenibacillus gansuensis]|uniref:Histidine kinase n=1 Tax=Paenibacillus gansuensis TaxID=306542 RepID=A0ABW5PGI9_9BACL
MVAGWIRKWTPDTLKNRILLSFIVFLIAPMAWLAVYNFRETEQMLQEQASIKNLEQLEAIKTGLVDVMSLVMKTGLLLEQDTILRSTMKTPGAYDGIQRKKLIENKFAGIENSFFLTGATVYYTLADFHGNAYTSFKPRNALNYQELMNEDWVRSLQGEGGGRYSWNANDDNYVVRERTKSSKMLSLYQLLRDDSLAPFAYGRFSIDYEEWFDRTTKERGQEGSYFLLDSSGRPMLSSDPSDTVAFSAAQAAGFSRAGGGDGKPGNSLNHQRKTAADADSFSIADQGEGMLYTFIRINQLDGYLVKKMPLSLLFKDITVQKQRFFLAFSCILLLFVLLTYLISSTITVPLKLFQKKMESTAKANLKVKLPEQGRGEILALTRSFNFMIDDLNALLEQLKLEERQKQFVRFQVLVAQMNPHFLLNTLNTIKSIALQKDEDDIYEICISLGKILETTLKTEVDLILLKDEMMLIDSYMDIQRKRFGHEMTVRYDIDADLEYALVPKFCLQPLVENALLHGFGSSGKQGSIAIHAEVRRESLYIAVRDNGVGMAKAAEANAGRRRQGIGLQLIRESLELIFKNQSTGLAIESSEEGTKVTLHMPILLSKPYAEEGNSHDKLGAVALADYRG